MIGVTCDLLLSLLLRNVMSQAFVQLIWYYYYYSIIITLYLYLFYGDIYILFVIQMYLKYSGNKRCFR